MSGRQDYEVRREAKLVRLRERAAKTEREGTSRLEGARKLSSIIPFGQPILVGHHSEKRHRKDLKRIHAGYDKGFSLLKLAGELRGRAKSAERNEAISSDDPNAPERIKAHIAALEKERDDMKEANAIVKRAARKGGDWKPGAIAKLLAAGFGSYTSAKLCEPDFAGRIGFADYELTNVGANIRRLRGRLQGIENNAALEKLDDEKIGDVTISVADNRVQLYFQGKPSETTRAALKRGGFRWAPSVGAWQRHASHQALHLARDVAKGAL
jgi:hypothetical protein